MAEPSITPHKITKPVQLLAAWFAALVLLDASTLAAAASIDKPEWVTPLLAIAAVLYVPAFVFGIFVMQTRFRPQLQEDPWYAQWLERTERNLLVTGAHIEQVDTAQLPSETCGRTTRRWARLQFTLVPSQLRIARGERFSIRCVLPGLGERSAPSVSGYTVVLLWNVRQVEFSELEFGDDLGKEPRVSNYKALLGPGVFNPADREFAAVVFGQYSHLASDELNSTQPGTITLAEVKFTSITDGPIRFNPGFPYGRGSLIDENRIPSFDVTLRALFLNQNEN